MIISHRFRFIFLKTKRVGGSSVEAALSHLCGEEDVVTPIGRQAHGIHRCPEGQNTRIPVERREPIWPVRRAIWAVPPIRRRYVRENGGYDGTMYWSHIAGRYVHATVSPEIWKSYYKVSIDRNPWDREVSRYFHRYGGHKNPPEFAEWVTRARPSNNFDIYSLDGEVALDKLMRFENLAADFQDFLQTVGAPKVDLPFVNASKRTDSNYRSMYDDRLREVVSARYAAEIGHWGYTF